MSEENTILVVRSSGQREKISLALTNSLKEFKQVVSESAGLGRIPIENQRVFHMGRELKTNGRSLESLGVGRMGVNILHVHFAPSKKRAATGKRQKPVTKPTAEAVIDLADDSDDDDCVVVDEVATARFSKRQRVG